MRPINAEIRFKSLEQCMCDNLQLVIAQRVDGALAIRQRVIESDFLRR